MDRLAGPLVLYLRRWAIGQFPQVDPPTDHHQAKHPKSNWNDNKIECAVGSDDIRVLDVVADLYLIANATRPGACSRSDSRVFYAVKVSEPHRGDIRCIASRFDLHFSDPRRHGIRMPKEREIAYQDDGAREEEGPSGYEERYCPRPIRSPIRRKSQ